MKKIFLTLLIILCFSTIAQAAETWQSGQSHFYSRRGLTGGGTALDALSGLSMCPNDYAVSLDISGNSIYFHQVSATGNSSGTTTEDSPFWIMPNSAASGQTVAGVSMWKLSGISGDTGYFKTLVIDTATLKSTDISAWNLIQSQVSTYVQSQVSDYAYNGTIQTWIADHTDLGSFTGTTWFALKSDLSSYTGTSPWVKQTEYNAALAPGAVSATSLYAVPATKTELTTYTATSPWATSNLANISGQTQFAGTSAFYVSFTAANPDCLVNGIPGGNTPFPIFNVDPQQYPNGITIIYANGQVSSGHTPYLFEFEEWNSGKSVAQVARFTTPATGASAWQSGATLVKEGSDVVLNPPTTGAYVIRGAIRFFRR
ncbi:MAG: hypothetical protein HQK77_14165 [Desulfobacterales bacterium]|nr:hypothetical protein [Desulfobacterales bacterium]